jgi:putative transporter
MTYIVTFKQISGFIYTLDNNLQKLIYRPFGYLSIRLSLMTSIFLTLFCNQSETLSFA